MNFLGVSGWNPILAKEQTNQMNRSKGTMSFHRLFSASEIGIGANADYFTTAVIRQFLKIGEAVAARWIEMPQGVLILQLVPGRADSGAIYLYDRRQQVFYMIGFDGPDDSLTLEEFNQLVVEYDLVRVAEHPNLIQLCPAPMPLPVPPPPPPVLENPLPAVPTPRLSVLGKLDLALLNGLKYRTGREVPWDMRQGATHLRFPTTRSA
jgi:hypothetical protein